MGSNTSSMSFIGFRFKGGKDRSGKFKGRGQIEFENGDLITGVFDNNLRHGDCRVETFRNGLRVIVGTYVKDKAGVPFN